MLSALIRSTSSFRCITTFRPSFLRMRNGPSAGLSSFPCHSHSVGGINVHVFTLTNVWFDLLDLPVEVALVPFLRLHESGVGRLDYIVQFFA